MDDPFETLAARLDELARAPERAAREAAPRLAEVVAAQHRAGLAPDGSPWPADKHGGVARLAELGAPTGRAEGATVVLELPDEFLPHQAGSGRLPQRKAVPAPGEALPDAYRAVIDEAVAHQLEGT